MHLYRFDPAAGRPIDRFGSQGAIITGLARLAGEALVSSLTLAPGGVLGEHPAAARQLFAVVSGEGQVRGAEGEARPISAGQAAFWEAGERHQTTTETGLTAIIIEGDMALAILPER